MSVVSRSNCLFSGLSFGAVLFAGSLNPQAAPPETPHPGWTIVNLRPDANFKPMVSGIGFFSDGRLAVAHWGGLHNDVHLAQKKGAVYILSDVTGDSPAPKVTTFASGLEDPVGLMVQDDKVYVTGGERLIELPDANKDGVAEAARQIVKIPGTHARHEFLFGLVFKDGKFWMNPSSGKDVATGVSAWAQLNPNRGTTMSVDPTTGAYEVFAMGLREPNGIGLGPDNELFVPDVQGNWLPANKLINVRKGRFYGFKHEPAETWDNMAVSPPVVYLPQTDVARAPGGPLLVPTGLYAGQMLLGDAVSGGIRRIALDKVNNEYQGSVFFFSGGFEAGPNRLVWGPDGHLYVGQCGQGAPDWAYRQDFGLQKLKPNGKATFEMLAVRSRQGGLEIEYTGEPNAAALDKANYTVRSWHYVSTSNYGGPATGTKALTVTAVTQSPDKKSVFLAITGLEANKVVYISLNAAIAASNGTANWTKETWYTMNQLSNIPVFAKPRSERQPVWGGTLEFRASMGRVDLRSNLGGIRSVEVRDVQGSRVAEIPGHGAKDLRIATTGWAPGVYNIAIRSEGDAMAYRKVAIP